VSQWATRVKVSIKGLGYVQVGAFDVNSNYLETKYALDPWRPGSARGVLVPVEIGWLPTFGDGLTGSYKVGAWYNSSTAPDVVENASGQPLVIAGGQPLMRHGQYGAYVNIEQRVTSPAPDRGLSVFLNATYADRRTSTLDNQIAAGLFYKGLFGSRPLDELGFAIGRTHVNIVSVQGSEYVGELFYSLHAMPWLELRPNVQYVLQPGGIAKNTNDIIIGLRLSINL
jgi:porin